MANQQASQVTATQVGSYFVQQYYQVFQQQRDFVHQFYNDSSSMLRVDGEISDSASDIVKIHQLLVSLDFTGIEIKTINSLESWNGGVLVVVTGSVKSRDFSAGRKFVQTFFLAPQEKGYFVLNDMFHFADEEVALQSSLPVAQEQNVDYQPAISSHLPDPSVSEYPLEEQARDYVSSIHIEGDEPVQEYSYQEHHQQEPEPELQPEQPEPEQEPVAEAETEPERLQGESHIEEPSPVIQSAVTAPQHPQPSAEEPVREPEKFTYASILRAKGKSPSSFVAPPVITRSTPPAAVGNHVSQPLLQQASQSRPSSRGSSVDEASSFKQGPVESKSVYVRNIPSTLTSLDILEEFKSFGRIKSDGVFLRSRPDSDVCYAFVEFEDVEGVLNAIKASPIQLSGRKIYIEERRPNTVASRGGRRGGGRVGGGRGGRYSGRGTEQNGFVNRGRANGIRATR